MSPLYQYQPESLYTSVVDCKNSSLEHIEFGVLRLRKMDEYEENTGKREVVLVILSGRCRIKSNRGSLSDVGGRRDVFSGLPYAVYVPPDAEYKVIGKKDVEIAVCKGRVQGPGFRIQGVRLITPNQVKSRTVGRENFKREVRDIVGEDFQAATLIVGETLSPPGNWSSFPPHKHDEENPPYEVRLEEVYYFKVFPREGFGIQRIYTNERDTTFCVYNNSAVVISKGYHPVVAGAGYSLYYLWVLAGSTRHIMYSEDPVHSWIK